MNRACAVVIVFAGLFRAASADPTSLETAQKALRSIKKQGDAPSFAQYVDLLQRDDIHLNEVEWITLRKLLLEMQEPEISRSDLAMRIATKRQMISAYVAEVTVKDIETGVERQYEFVVSGNNCLRRTWNLPGNGQSILDWAISYDGQVVRDFKPPRNQGHMYPLDDSFRTSLYEPHSNPLGSSMLMDAKSQLGEEWLLAVDLARLLAMDETILYSQRQQVDGHSCLVVDHHNTVAYLDPELDFGVVRRERWTYDHEKGGPLARDKRWMRCEEFQDFGDGWLFPRKVIYEELSTGKGDVVTVDKLMINRGVLDSTFQTDIFPDGIPIYETLADGTIIQRR
jgi:hypothetical protein